MSQSNTPEAGALQVHLQKHFGYHTFRPLQEQIIQHTLNGGDSVVLMPTGGGKSICFQLPAVISGGLTLVVSPLIALMKDQVESLQANGIAAACLNSSLSASEAAMVRARLQRNEIRLLYVSPERLFAGNFMDYLKSWDIRLIAIDEAHCVSSWGHHFRPEYKKLAALKDAFPGVPAMALTATADKAVRSDIGALLGLNEPEYFLASFDRPNLSLAVLPGQQKWQQIRRIVKRHPGKSGIIYCTSRIATEKLSEKLRNEGLRAKCYHAGLDSEERNTTQEQFLQGQVHIICATIAFGMGIDKSDIRFVIHQNMPGNLESYYQEIGRAGRDGKPAETVLFYSYRDVQTHMGFIEEIDDEQYKEIQLAKLKRMQEYAEGQVCRRKILLTYFSEVPAQDCGNCDVCHNPPEYFDGTIQSQIALSAVKRLKEQAGIKSLVDVLRGIRTQTVSAHNFDQIKTFGTGRSLSSFAWQIYLQQMLQQGLVELDYKDHYTLKLTHESHEVLFNGKRVRLVSPRVIKARQETTRKASPTSIPDNTLGNQLFEALRSLRSYLADKAGKPVFTIFSNSSLQEMVNKMPSTHEEFLEIEGVGEYKAKMYSTPFLGVIARFRSDRREDDTFLTTLRLYTEGMSVQQIAKTRSMQTTTVYSHLGKLISDGYRVNIQDLLTRQEFEKVREAREVLGAPAQLTPYHNFLGRTIEYGKIRVALSYLERKR